MNDTLKYGEFLAQKYHDEISKCPNIQEMENLCIKIENKITCDFIASTLEILDERIYKEKDPEYKVHSLCKRMLLTEVGDVVFSRRLYKDRYGNICICLTKKLTFLRIYN